MMGKGTKDQETVRWSIRWKLMAIITVLVVGLVAILSYVQISSQKKMMEDELNNRIELIKANLIERGKSFTINLSRQVENHIASMNISGMMEAVNESVQNNKEIKYAILMDSSGVARIHTLRPDLAQSPLTGLRDRKALSQKNITVTPYKEGDESVIEIVSPIQISTEPWGVLRLFYTLRFLEREIEIFRKQVRQEANRMIYRSIVTSLGFLGVSLIIIFILSTRITKPIVQLTESARKLSRGDFSGSSDIHIRSQDEVGVLGETFSEMSKALEDYYKKLEEQVKERTRDLTDALVQLEKANRHKSEFLANMSHELRTPLNAILGYTELILDKIYGEVPEKIRETLERLEKNGRHLLGLINDVLDLSKIEAGRITLSLNDYSMAGLVQTVITGVESLAAEKNLELKTTVPPNLAPGKGDEQRIAQVFLNLVGNAIKFTEEGEVRVEVAASNKSFHVSVSDTGPGLSEDDQQMIFEEFHQVDGSSTRKKGGTGLGLSISKKIVEMHGGSIGVESTPGEGSTFWFTLPIRVDQQKEI